MITVKTKQRKNIMKLPDCIRYIRSQIIAGKHLHNCFADSNVRATGWRKIQAARRIERRLKLNVGIHL
jgi:hypothetical protein